MRISWWSHRDRIALVAALVLPFGVAGVLMPFRGSFANTDAALVLVVVIVAVAANGHRFAGLLAAASAAIWFDFFLTKPYERFTITHRADLETTLLLLVVGAAVTELAVQGRRQRRIALTDAAYLAAIGETTDLVASGAAPQLVIDRVTAHLTALLGLRGCRFERFSFGGMPRLEEDGRLRIDDGYWDLDEYGMPGINVEILASSRSGTHGRFVLDPTPGSLAPQAARQVAVILANQVASALANQVRIAG